MTIVETELAAARMLLEAITEGRLKMRIGGKDVTERASFAQTRDRGPRKDARANPP